MTKNRTLLQESDRFWENVEVGTEKECWNWKGALDDDGYGRFSVGKTGWASKYGCKMDCRAHRFSYVLHNREVLNSRTLVCHTCDNPTCVNPDHLFLGTSKSNTEDRHKKGRSARGSRIGTSRFTEDLILWLRKKHATGLYTYYQLCLLFKKKKGMYIAESTIGYIISGQSWKHVGGLPNGGGNETKKKINKNKGGSPNRKKKPKR